MTTPSEPTHGQVDIGDLTFAYRISGSGTPIVFIHGLAASASTWDYMETALGSVAQCISIDVPGYSLDLPGVQPVPLTQLAESICKVVNLLVPEQRIVLVGHSLGGSLALMCSELQELSISGMVLLAPAGFAIEVGLPVRIVASRFGPGVLRILHLPLFYSPLDRYVSFRLRRSVNFRSTPAAQAFEALSRLGSASTRSQLRLSSEAALDALSSMSLPEQFSPSTLATPTTVIWGGRDTILPVSASALVAERLSNASIEVVGRAGHAPHRTHPAAVAKILQDFLSRTE